jgi:hypothetical protein
MRTTLTLDDDVAVQVEALRRSRRISLKAAVNEALRRGLAAIETEPKPRRAPFRTPTFNMGPALMPIDNVAEVLSIIEGEDHA